MTVYELIEKHEGRRLKPYKCTAGKNTIGVGWNMDDNPLPPNIASYLAEHGEITDEMVNVLLKLSVMQADDDCQDLFDEFVQFSKNRRMALTDFVFQLGLTKARKFVKAVKAINECRWVDAAAEMRNSAWFKQVPDRAKEITEMIERG